MKKRHNPAVALTGIRYDDPYRGVNPSISDSATFSFEKASYMKATFEGKTEGMYLYTRHSSPTNRYLERALAAMEGTEDAYVTASGMGAISTAILQICRTGDHIVAGRTIYGGTYAFLKNYLPKLGINTTFVDMTDLELVGKAITKDTKIIYTESVSNPLLEISDIPALAEIAHSHGAQLVVDNTFSPLIMTPHEWGADIVVHSLTKFINGMNDTVGGVVCADADFVNAARSVNDGAAMLLGPVMDSIRSASILKNTKTLPVRMRKHSGNALYIARELERAGYRTGYPGLESHRGHDTFVKLAHPEFGSGGMMTIDLGTLERAEKFMEYMQEKGVGELAVSLGFYRTLFNAPGTGTSSEVPEEEQAKMGLTPGLVRFSMGLDDDIEHTWQLMKGCLERV